MDQKADSTFMRQFSGIIAGMVVLTIALIVLARYFQPEPSADANPSKGVLVVKRISPVGAVRFGDEGAAMLAEAQTTSVEAVPAADVVVDGPAVYDSLCKTCHVAGIANAPIPGTEQMAAREAERGVDGLVQNVINGLNAMPARGGNPNLTDQQIQAAVEFMLQ